MPLIDMPLSELRQYTGSNVRPDDIDEYWEKALNEMKSIDPQVTLTPSEFSSPFAECYDMYFTGVGGARVYAKFLRPKNINKKCPAVIGFHGYSGASGSWFSKLPFAASIFLDTAQLADIIMSMDEVDENRVGCYGGSQGGALTVACASLEPRIKRAVPQFPFLCDYKRVWDMGLDTAPYSEIREWFRNFDPTHKREDEFFHTLGYIDLQHLSHRIKADMQMHTGLMDTACPPSTQFAAYNKMTCNKEVIIYPDFGHEVLPGADDAAFKFLMKL